MEGISQNDFYFVAFGKTRGGYYDLLGLPANASQAEAKKREGEYRNELDRVGKSAKGKYHEQFVKKEITDQEFKKFKEEIDKEYNNALSRLNKLKEELTAKLAASRGGGISGPDWFPMYKMIKDPSDVQELVFQNHPMKQQTPDTGRAGYVGNVESNNIDENHHLFGRIIELTERRNLLMLRRIDDFVGKSDKFPTLKNWHVILVNMSNAYAELYGGILTSSVVSETVTGSLPQDKDTAYTVLFPGLNQPHSLQLEHLEEQEIEDYSKTPERKGDVPSFEELLRRELLKLLLAGKFPTI
jgi:hypothetical protein